MIIVDLLRNAKAMVDTPDKWARQVHARINPATGEEQICMAEAWRRQRDADAGPCGHRPVRRERLYGRGTAGDGRLAVPDNRGKWRRLRTWQQR